MTKTFGNTPFQSVYSEYNKILTISNIKIYIAPIKF